MQGWTAGLGPRVRGSRYLRRVQLLEFRRMALQIMLQHALQHLGLLVMAGTGLCPECAVSEFASPRSLKWVMLGSAPLLRRCTS